MTPDEMRAKAKELVQGAQKQIAGANLSPAELVQVAAITDQVNAYTLVTFADFMEASNPDVRKARAAKILKWNDSVRKAAAKGYAKNDWSEFDSLVDAGLPNGGEAGGNGST
jgi:hypothetical protein